MAPGSRVDRAIQRNGQPKDLSVMLAETTPATSSSPSSSSPKGGNDTTLGMTIEALTPEIARQVGVPVGTPGVAVTDIDDSSAAFLAGIHTGDVIRSVDGQSVTSASGLRDALSRQTDRPALLLVQ